MKRSEFFSEALRVFVNDNPLLRTLEKFAEKPQAKPRKHRPPGASLDDKKFRQKCTGCDACMIACPVNVIMIEDMEKRHPVIYPDVDPCVHCEDYPCIQSCPTGALLLMSTTN